MMLLINNPENIKEIIESLQKTLLPVPANLTVMDELQKSLTAIINDLITNNFSRLISILYTLDIPEKKLKELLSSKKSTLAAQIIAALIIERQIQKIMSRRSHRPSNNIPDDEKW